MKTLAMYSGISSLLIAALLAGCNTSETSVASEPEVTPTVTPGINGTQIYSKNLGASQRVEFYDFGQGSIGVREVGSIDEVKTPFLKSGDFSSLEQVYRTLNPKSGSVPGYILKADQKALAQAWEPGMKSQFLTQPSREIALPKASATQAACSGDFYNDGWGATWFKSNFCTEGYFRYCYGNMARYNSGDFRVSWAKWEQMAGDFNNSNRIFATYIPYNIIFVQPRTTLMDHEIQPRHYEIWQVGGKNMYNFTGQDYCNHLHVNLLWN